MEKTTIIKKLLERGNVLTNAMAWGRVKAPGLGQTLQMIRKELKIADVKGKSFVCKERHTNKQYIMLFENVESIDGMSLDRLAEAFKINTQ